MSDSRLQEVLDRQEINELMAHYCAALDTMDLSRLGRLFTPDCTVAYGPDPRLQACGNAELTRSLERMWRWSRTSHHLSNVCIEFEGADDARASSYVLAWHERADGSTATIYGQYRDVLRRQDGVWRIHDRRMLMNGCDAGFKVDIFPLTRNAPPAGWIAPDIDKV